MPATNMKKKTMKKTDAPGTLSVFGVFVSNGVRRQASNQDSWPAVRMSVVSTNYKKTERLSERQIKRQGQI
jgi:hypothetical protein